MSDCGLLIGAGLGGGAGVAVGCYVGYKILKKKNPKLLEKIVADIKKGFSEGFNKACSMHDETEASKKTIRTKPSRFKGLTCAFYEGFNHAYRGTEVQYPPAELA